MVSNLLKSILADALRNSFQIVGNAFGYATGGTVTQLTGKSTTVILNAPTGEITMNNALLATITPVSFTLTNAFIKAGDYLAVQHVSGGTVGQYTATAVCAAGSATITVYQSSGGNLSEAIVVKFFLHKASTT